MAPERISLTCPRGPPRTFAPKALGRRTRMLKIDNRIVMVSGASRGIGRAVVDRLIQSGFRVSAGLRDPSRLKESDQLMTHRYDAENAESPISWVKATVARWGGVDALVNTAGINPKVRVSDDG